MILIPAKTLVGLILHHDGATAVLASAKSAGGLRGLDIRATKTGPAAWSPIRLERLGFHNPETLPQEFDLTDSLCLLWGVDHLPIFAPLLRIAEGGDV